MTFLSEKVGDGLLNVSRRPRVAVKPGRSSRPGVVASVGQITVSWARPHNGASSITGYIVKVRQGTTVVQTFNVGPGVTSQVVSGLTPGASYTATVEATNAVGTGPPSEASQPSSPLTAEDQAIVFPDESTTGVPIGIPGDTRPPVTLTPVTAIPAAAWFSRNTSSGFLRFIIKQQPPEGALHRIDFTNCGVTVNTPGPIKFTECLFRIPNLVTAAATDSFPFGRTPANLLDTTVAVEGLTLERCTLDGQTVDPLSPASNMMVQEAGSKNIVVDQCRILGMANALIIADVDGYTARKNLVRGLTATRVYVRGFKAVPGAGSLPPGTYYVSINAVYNSTKAGDQETVLNPGQEKVVHLPEGGGIDCSWVARANAGIYSVTGYRIWISDTPGVPKGPEELSYATPYNFRPDLRRQSYDGFFFVPGGATTSASYTGQALSTGPLNKDYTYSDGHGDCVQCQSNYARNVLIEDNNFHVEAPDRGGNSAGIQIGTMKGSGPQPHDVTNLVYQRNRCEGGANQFNAYTATDSPYPTLYQGKFHFIGNHIGLHLNFGVKSVRMQTVLDRDSPDAKWEGNVWAETGFTIVHSENGGAPVYHVKGELIP